MPNIDLHLDRRLFNDVYYQQMFDYSHKYNVYYGGAGSGKSVAITQKLLIKAMKNKRKILVIRKVGATLKDSVFQLFKDVLSQWHLISYCNVNQSTFSLSLPNGSLFLFKGLDDNEKIKSIAGITDIWIEEATELIQDDFTQLCLRLRDNKATNQEIYLSFNPVSKQNWCYKYWFENEPPTNTFILKTTYKDNHFLQPDYIKTFEDMKRTNPTYYRIYALGEFATLNKLVYENWKSESFDTGEIIRQGAKLICGLDFGYTADPTAFIAALILDKKIYVFKEFYKAGLTNPEIAQMITSLGFCKSEIIADCAENKSIEEIKRCGCSRIRPCAKGADSIRYGIEKLKQYEIIVLPECENVIMELENYSYKKDKQTGEYTNEPIDSFNHCLDATRYAIQIVEGKNKLQTISKDKLGIW